MITIKVQCPCGQKYAFEINPADALIDHSVRCPVCALDGTAAARELMAESSGSAVSQKLGLRPNEFSQSAQPPSLEARSGSTQTQPDRDLPKAMKCLIPIIASATIALGVVGASVRAMHGQKRTVQSSSTSVEEGFPQTLAQVQASYLEPESGQNGATYYQQGLDTLQLRNLSLSDIPILGKLEVPEPLAPLPGSMRSGIGALLRSNQDAIRHFGRGAKFDRSRYAVDLSRGCDTLYPHLAQLKSAFVILELAALFHADAHNSTQVAEDIEVDLALADSLKAEPAILSQVVRTMGVSRAMMALEQSLNRTELPSEALVRLATCLHRMEESCTRGDGFNMALAAARVGSLALLAEPEKILESLHTPGLKVSPKDVEELSRRLAMQSRFAPEIEFYDRAARRILSARKSNFPNRLQSDLVAQEEMALARSKHLTALELVLPELLGRTTQEAECLTELRLGATAVALERYRQAHDGRYPDAVTALVPEYLPIIPVDPFHSQILVYEKKGDGYALHSTAPRSDTERHGSLRLGRFILTVRSPLKRGP